MSFQTNYQLNQGPMAQLALNPTSTKSSRKSLTGQLSRLRPTGKSFQKLSALATKEARRSLEVLPQPSPLRVKLSQMRRSADDAGSACRDEPKFDQLRLLRSKGLVSPSSSKRSFPEFPVWEYPLSHDSPSRPIQATAGRLFILRDRYR